MIKVKLIHNTYISARNGANTVIRSLLDSKAQFEENRIQISSLSPDTLHERSFEPNSKDAMKNLRRKKIKMWMKKLAQCFSPAAIFIVYLSDIRPAKKIVNYYIASNPDDDVVFFHSLITCYYYLKLRRKQQKTVVVCHTNGDNFKMSRTYYPTLK